MGLILVFPKLRCIDLLQFCALFSIVWDDSRVRSSTGTDIFVRTTLGPIKLIHSLSLFLLPLPSTTKSIQEIKQKHATAAVASTDEKKKEPAAAAAAAATADPAA